MGDRRDQVSFFDQRDFIFVFEGTGFLDCGLEDMGVEAPLHLLWDVCADLLGDCEDGLGGGGLGGEGGEVVV